jgi:hypothetical protein
MPSPARHSRYPVVLTVLMVTLVIFGFLLNLSGSKALAIGFALAYVAFFVGWAVMARSSGPKA